MKTLFLMMALFAGQLQDSRSTTLVRLTPPHNGSIPASAAGESVELINPPSTVSLPHPVPNRDSAGNAWSVEVRNMASSDVTIVQIPAFEQMGPEVVVVLHSRERARIRANGSRYVVVGR
jgi:hypothetical protein